MGRLDKPIRLSGHAQGHLQFRGTSLQEVTAAIETGEWQDAELCRLECRKDFPYNADRFVRFLWMNRERLS